MRRVKGPENRKLAEDENMEEQIDSKVKGSRMIKKVVKYEINGRAFDTEEAAKAEELRFMFANMVKSVDESESSKDAVMSILQTLRDMIGLSKPKLQKIIDSNESISFRG